MENRTLLARQRAREKAIPLDGHVFTIRRPKPAEMLGDITRIELVRRFTVGWDLKNMDLVPGGTPEPEPFDAALWADYVDDNDALWAPLSEAIVAAWDEHQKALESAEKN